MDPFAFEQARAQQTELLLLTLRSVLWRQFKYAAGMVLLYILLVSAAMSTVERWSYGRSVYFVFASVTTIGFGDVVAETVLGRSIYMWFLVLGIGLVTYLGSVIAEVIANQWKIQTAHFMKSSTR
jgi:hypothetical protein